MRRVFILHIILLFAVGSFAQNNTNQSLVKASANGWEYKLKAGFNIGGVSPLPLPIEIRSVDGYNPNLLITLGADVTKWIGKDKKWGISTGVKLENKGMTTKATVKDYSMAIIGDDGSELDGNWTGGVRTKVSNSYITVPVLVAYKLNHRFNIKAGPFISYLMNGDFSGSVYEGYLRKDNPTGDKIIFDNGAISTYDFSDNLDKISYGVQAGAEWNAFKHLIVYGDFSWGLNDIFKSSFETITFNMYPIYMNIGFGYRF